MRVSTLVFFGVSPFMAAAVQDDRRHASPDTYDFIIVGGGTAGNALAARLSQGLPDSSILVIEAGPAAVDELGIDVPGRKGSTLGGQYDWNFTTTPQAGIKDRVVGVNRGKVLGGSSALNLMVWDRAAAAEYDAWEAMGNPGWNWDNMIEAMTKADNFTGKNSDVYGESGLGEDGPIKSVVNRFRPAHQEAFIPTVSEAFDIPTNLESLGGDPIGVMLQPSNVDPTRYTRSYSANAYLPMAGDNLEVMTDTTVTKVNLRKWGGKQVAIGVTLEDGRSIKARKEVILSAGAVQSPGLLELSGIGQKNVIGAAGIRQLVDLPGVGENYQDHIRVQTSYQLKKNFTSFDILRHDSEFAAGELQKWMTGESSFYDYTASGYIFSDWKRIVGDTGNTELVNLAEQTLGGSNSPIDKHKLAFMQDASIPQVEVIFSDGYTGMKGYPAQDSPLYGEHYFTLLAGLMHPLSRGSVHINPEDNFGKPIIDPRYLDNEHDIEAMVKAIKFCRQIALSEPLRSVWTTEYDPGLDVVTTDEDWRQFVLNTTLSIFHPTSTCAMMPRENGGVVDPRLRVYGTRNLRVVDASIIPIQVSAHIQTAVYGIAERAAELMVAQYKTQ